MAHDRGTASSGTPTRDDGWVRLVLGVGAGLLVAWLALTPIVAPDAGAPARLQFDHDEDGYVAYATAVRAEYGHVDDAAWRLGRRAVLRSFLDRPRIFRTITGRERWESRARINISSELASLG